MAHTGYCRDAPENPYPGLSWGTGCPHCLELQLRRLQDETERQEAWRRAHPRAWERMQQEAADQARLWPLLDHV